MKEGAKDSIFIKKFELKGYKLNFRSKLELQILKNSIVPGISKFQRMKN